MRIIAPAFFRKGLWKNGRGVSWDIATQPSVRGAEFGWRLSIAEISEDCAFSLYGPVDRVFTLIEGAGVDLVVNSRRIHVSECFKPVAFACDVSTNCALLDGRCRALNLFTARGEWDASAEVIAIPDIIDIDAKGGTALLFALKADTSIAANGTVSVLCAGEAMVIAGDAGIISAAARGSLLYVARLRRLA